MIAHIFDDLCTACGVCVSACPSHVFDMSAAGAPIIARLDQCQTCYLCELYCTEDAIYVAPDQFAPEHIDPEAIRASGHLGRMRHDQGWNTPDDAAPLDVYWRLGPLLGKGAKTALERYAQKRKPSSR